MIAGPVTLVAWRPVPAPAWTAASEVSSGVRVLEAGRRVAGVGGADEGRVPAGRRGRQRTRRATARRRPPRLPGRRRARRVVSEWARRWTWLLQRWVAPSVGQADRARTPTPPSPPHAGWCPWLDRLERCGTCAPSGRGEGPGALAPAAGLRLAEAGQGVVGRRGGRAAARRVEAAGGGAAGVRRRRGRWRRRPGRDRRGRRRAGRGAGAAPSRRVGVGAAVGVTGAGSVGDAPACAVAVVAEPSVASRRIADAGAGRPGAVPRGEQALDGLRPRRHPSTADPVGHPAAAVGELAPAQRDAPERDVQRPQQQREHEQPRPQLGELARGLEVVDPGARRACPARGRRSPPGSPPAAARSRRGAGTRPRSARPGPASARAAPTRPASASPGRRRRRSRGARPGPRRRPRRPG